MAGREYRLPIAAKLPLFAKHITITAYNLFVVRIPHDKLLATIGHQVKFIYILCLSRTATGTAESLFAQSSNFVHQMRSFACREYIDVVMTLICTSQQSVWSKFTFQKFLTDWLDNFFFLHIIAFYRISLFRITS